MKLIVGLGNPETKYDNTRHNIGFQIIDGYIKDANWQKKFNGLYTEQTINNEKVLFLKPLTYMNNSGLAVGEIVNYYKINLDDILIIQDDLDENFGDYKLKKNSSSGGHNGIKSIISALNSEAFGRLKVGINNAQKDDVIDFVLGKFSGEEQKKLTEMQETFNAIIDSFINVGMERTMNIYNTK